MVSKSGACLWDFTISVEHCNDKNLIIDFLKEKAKKWTFQKELSETGYEHWQGRLSLHNKTKKMIGELEELKPHWSLTSTEGGRTFSYCQKADTRTEGPWKDTDEILFIPIQIERIKELMPWQQHIVDSAKIFEDREINYVYCPEGNKGKTTLVHYCGCYGIGRHIPISNDYKDILRMVYCTPTSKMYLFDMPKAINKDKLVGFFAGIETIKDGYAYDDRYTFKEKRFNCPVVWIFSNKKPDTSLLSEDRWILWRINSKKELTRINS